jgi:cytochrome c oxidase subunit 2
VDRASDGPEKRIVNKFWALLFLLVPILGVFVFACSDSVFGMWLPRDVSDSGYKIDGLFFFILGLTGVVFIATEVVLFWFLWKYDAATNREPVKYTHGSHNLEIIWTILPAATLLFIAIYQMHAWADSKISRPDVPVTARVIARQFEWRLVYPGPDGKLDTPDDIHDVNDLHVPVDETVLIELVSEDVLHDFFLPNLRVKQDAVPGMAIPVWFKARDTGIFDLVCAELCGWGHYKMKGRLTVESRSQFDAWLAAKAAEQNATQAPVAATE